MENKPYIAPERVAGCLLCEELLIQTDGLVAETTHWRVIVSRDQGYLGRCMVIPLRHLASEAELTAEEVMDFHYAKIALESAVKDAFGAELCNWTELGNDAFQENVPRPHLHHHMRPRYRHPIEFAGKTFEDPQWGRMYDLNQRWNVDKDLSATGFKDAVGRFNPP